MRELTKTELKLLTGASADEGVIPIKPQARIAAALVKEGMVIALPQSKGPSKLLITTKGRKALGEPVETPAAAPILTNTEGAEKRPANEDVEASALDTSPAATPPEAKGKLGILIGLLRQPEGAAISDLMAATGWQAHSVRGAIAGSLKKKLGLTVISAKSDTGRVYRIVEGEVEG